MSMIQDKKKDPLSKTWNRGLPQSSKEEKEMQSPHKREKSYLNLSFLHDR